MPSPGQNCRDRPGRGDLAPRGLNVGVIFRPAEQAA